MKKFVCIVGGAALLGILAFISTANLFPDQTWNALDTVRSVYAVLASPRPSPPNAPVLHPASAPYTDADAYAVMSAWKHYWAKERVISVREEIKPDPHSVTPPELACLPEGLRKNYAEAMNDLNSRWSQRWILESRFVPAQEFVIVPEAQLPGRESRNATHSSVTGRFAFSAVGFDRSRQTAAVYVTQRDGVYGWGEVFLMRKTGGGVWVIDGNGQCGWIA